MLRLNRLALFFFGMLTAGTSFAAGDGIAAKFISYYKILLKGVFGIKDEHLLHELMPVVGAALTFVLLLITGLIYAKHARARLASDLSPTGRFDLANFVEMILDFVYQTGADVIGKDRLKPFFGLLAALFFFIFFSNLSGLVPGFTPATESMNTNLAMALAVFLVYNYAGLREHGMGYSSQFFGPVWWLIPLMLPIELVGHLARPVSLSLRLYGNIFGDHLVLSVFTGLAYVLASPLLLFGLLVASLQSFVFMLLTSIYISSRFRMIINSK